jgi:type II secretory pathway pseudopilin PulG
LPPLKDNPPYFIPKERLINKMSLIATAKTKIASGTVSEAFKNEEGAIDLASIMVGIIVIGLIGGVIAATVFSVIPWAQDNAAKQQLDSIAAAQSSYIGLSSDKGNAKFGGGAITGSAAPYTYAAAVKTVGADGTVTESLFNGGTAKVGIGNWGAGNAAHYAAAAKSASGKTFYITDAKTQPTDEAVTASTNQAKAVVDIVKGL